MRFIIYSKTAGTYLEPNFGGQYFSGYASSTFTNTATTWPSRHDAQVYASEQFCDEDDPNDLEVLSVETGEPFATMAECIAAGTAPWEHHIKRLANDPDCYNRPASDELLSRLGNGGLVFGGGIHRSSMSLGASFVLPHLLKTGRQRLFLFDADRSSTVRDLKPELPGDPTLAPSGQGKSMLDGLTDDERSALSEWSAAQPGDPQRGGAIDLMQWPGWKDVMARRYKERFGAEMPKADS